MALRTHDAENHGRRLEALLRDVRPEIDSQIAVLQRSHENPSTGIVEDLDVAHELSALQSLHERIEQMLAVEGAGGGNEKETVYAGWGHRLHGHPFERIPQHSGVDRIGLDAPPQLRPREEYLDTAADIFDEHGREKTYAPSGQHQTPQRQDALGSLDILERFASSNAEDFEREAIINCSYEVRRALSAGVPEGWKLVPVEPTNKMLNDGMQHVGEIITLHTDDQGNRIPGINPALWRVMLAAAPQPQEDYSDE